MSVDDVSDDARAATELVPVDADYEGPAVIAGYTVVHDRGAPTAGIAVVDTPAGARTVATSSEPDVAAAMTHGEWIGRTVTVRGGALVV